jgi:hypothetical protein
MENGTFPAELKVGLLRKYLWRLPISLGSSRAKIEWRVCLQRIDKHSPMPGLLHIAATIWIQAAFI